MNKLVIPVRMYFSKILRIFFCLFAAFLSVPILYVLLSVLFSSIPVNRNNFIPRQDDPFIYLLSNGVHLDIVVPMKSSVKDWSEDLIIPRGIVNHESLVAFGWGDRDFYLKTPRWSDLKFKTAFNALFLKDSSALHITYITSLRTDQRCKKLYIPEANYKILISSIEDSFLRTTEGRTNLIENAGYTLSDQFYEAKRSYSLFYTCNTWSNQVLKKSGLRACLWTPFDRGILWQYRNY